MSDLRSECPDCPKIFWLRYKAFHPKSHTVELAVCPSEPSNNSNPDGGDDSGLGVLGKAGLGNHNIGLDNGPSNTSSNAGNPAQTKNGSTGEDSGEGTGEDSGEDTSGETTSGEAHSGEDATVSRKGKTSHPRLETVITIRIPHRQPIQNTVSYYSTRYRLVRLISSKRNGNATLQQPSLILRKELRRYIQEPPVASQFANPVHPTRFSSSSSTALMLTRFAGGNAQPVPYIVCGLRLIENGSGNI